MYCEVAGSKAMDGVEGSIARCRRRRQTQETQTTFFVRQRETLAVQATGKDFAKSMIIFVREARTVRLFES